MIADMTLEQATTNAGMLVYLVAAAVAVVGEVRRRPTYRLIIGLIVVALVVHGAGIGLRWERLEHGPYVNQYETLSGNIHTMHTALLLAVLAVPRLRPLLGAVLPLLAVMVVWFLSITPFDSILPLTYSTVWLPIHVWLGKIFMGVMLPAVGGSVVILVRWGLAAKVFPNLPRSGLLDEVNYRLVLLALVFDSLLLLAGALWAQDAWGRFWSWDPLETWSFLTWLSVVGYLHLRAVTPLRPQWSAVLVLLVFMIAYYTFYGVPFVSTSVHRGVV